MKERILLVEDDSTLSMIVSETLQRDGFDVTIASDGEQGLRNFERYGADMIVADVMMPRMYGFEMARKIRQIDRHIPILFLTARSEISDIVEDFELGGNDYLKKTVQNARAYRQNQSAAAKRNTKRSRTI